MLVDYLFAIIEFIMFQFSTSFMKPEFLKEESSSAGGEVTISDVVVEYDELDTPQTPAHELWLGANWLNDQLDIELPDEGLTGKGQEVMVIEEEKQGGYVEIHHSHAEPVPSRISSIL